jgi:hypothetical protein
MTGTRSKRREQFTDAQIRERIGNILGQPQKASHLTFALLFAFPFLAVTLSMAVPTGFKEMGAFWGKVIWTLVAALGWKRLSPSDLKRLPKEQQRRHLHQEMIWFHVWKAGTIVLVSIAMLLLGLGGLSVLELLGWVKVLAIGGYVLTFFVSFWQRRRILRSLVEGWSADTRWGRLMLRLAAIGPAVGASIGSGIGIALVRLHILPGNILLAYAGLTGILVAGIMVPQVISDLSVAWIHWQIRRVEMNQEMEGV